MANTTLTLDQRVNEAMEYARAEVLRADLVKHPNDWHLVSTLDVSAYNDTHAMRPRKDMGFYYLYVLAVIDNRPKVRCLRKAVQS